MSWKTQRDEIEQRRRAALEQGGEDAVARQHGKGLLTIRERIDGLLDANSFREVGPIAGSGEHDEDGNLTEFQPANFVLGTGRIEGRHCVVGGEDFTQGGGSPNAAGLRKSVYTEELAVRYRVPLVRLHQGAGGSVAGSSGTGQSHAPVYETHRFRSIARALKTVPVASAALGAVAGMPAGRLVSSHFAVMTRNSQVLIGGPALVERALKRQLTKEELGGPEVHESSGVVDAVVDDEFAAFDAIRRFLSYLPANVSERPPVVETTDAPERRDETLNDVIPDNRKMTYDVRLILHGVLDRGSVFEMTAGYGPSLITALARLNGVPVGVLANDCTRIAGAMDANACRKLKRFVEFCEQFHLPVISFVDEPGFMIGLQAEQDGTIRAGAEALTTVATTTVPWASVVMRKSMGLASALHYGDQAYVLAWPSAEFGALPVEGGVALAFKRDIEAAEDPEAKRQELEAQFAARQSPFPRAEAFAVHDLINPDETRMRLCGWLELSRPLLDEPCPSAAPADRH